MPCPLIPAGYAAIAEAAPRFGMTDNAVRLAARRRRIGALLIRGKVYVKVADLERLFEPQPYPPTAA